MKKILKTVLILLIVISSVSSMVATAAAVFVARNIRSDEDIITVDPSSNRTEFYCFDHGSSNGIGGVFEPTVVEGATLDSGIKYTFVPLDKIPDNLINAFIAIEDKRFYSHFGVDPIRTARAVFNYFSGQKRFGGSTITQQLVKNLTGRDEATVQRKINEIGRAHV